MLVVASVFDDSVITGATGSDTCVANTWLVWSVNTSLAHEQESITTTEISPATLRQLKGLATQPRLGISAARRIGGGRNPRCMGREGLIRKPSPVMTRVIQIPRYRSR